VISAEASSNDANGGDLVGSLPGFAEGAAIPMGKITAAGLFIPPKARAFRMVAGEAIPDYPGTDRITDNSSDGSISVRLTAGERVLDVLPACIVVCGHDFSPDTSEPETLIDFFKEELQISPTAPSGNLHNQAARALDEAALKSSTADFAPGVEMSLGRRREETEVVDVKSVFYSSSQDQRVDPRESRVRYKTSLADAGPGAVPGQLTSGLCSPWQSDYMACIGYWTEHLPPEVYLREDAATIVKEFRKQYADTSATAATLTTGDDLDRHIDQVGVARLRSGKKVETERGPGDDIQDRIA
jgi:hypothetical protein